MPLKRDPKTRQWMDPQDIETAAKIDREIQRMERKTRSKSPLEQIPWLVSPDVIENHGYTVVSHRYLDRLEVIGALVGAFLSGEIEEEQFREEITG
jgi:hypothetical protein